jgi:hypothetical protein
MSILRGAVSISERERFDHWVARATRAFHLGRIRESAALARHAAVYALRCHVDVFYSAEIETLLTLMAAQNSIVSGRHASNQRVHKVLHVLTRAYPTGGHTRIVWRWIEADKGREHHIVITQQDAFPVPSQLQFQAEKSGGRLRIFDKSTDLREDAIRLRQFGSDFDIIVLHIHPWDVVPQLAWGDVNNHPPIAFLNHADNVFWIGASLADLVINLRQSGLRVSQLRRGIPEERNAILPTPLSDCLPKQSRQDARAKLSIDDDEFVALTVAREDKFVPFNDIDFANFHQPLLEMYEKLRIILVGPSTTAPYWKQWAKIINGRIQAVGTQEDISAHLSAADIYLDSFPFASVTSLLDAALAGVPAVAWHPYPEGALANVMSMDDPALDGLPLITYSDKAQYIARIGKLLTDAKEAKSYAQTVRTALLDMHTGDGWRDRLETIYQRTLTLATKRPHGMKKEALACPDLLDEILRRTAGRPRPIEVLEDRFLPYFARLRFLAEGRFSLYDILYDSAKSFVPLSLRRSLKSFGAVVQGNAFAKE